MTMTDLFLDIGNRRAADVAIDLPARLVGALCVAPNSVYKRIPGVEVFDKARDVRTFAGGMPVVAHPPCRAWSAYTAHQSRPHPDEKELGHYCAEMLRKEGGVLEHPAHTRLFKAAGLPMPGQRQGDLYTMLVSQAWWGYPMRKATWLCFCGVDIGALTLPYRSHDSSAGVGDRRRQQVMSNHQRAATCEPLAHWLVDVARSAATPQPPKQPKGKRHGNHRS
jgi:hypothetical protein